MNSIPVASVPENTDPATHEESHHATMNNFISSFSRSSGRPENFRVDIIDMIRSASSSGFFMDEVLASSDPPIHFEEIFTGEGQVESESPWTLVDYENNFRRVAFRVESEAEKRYGTLITSTYKKLAQKGGINFPLNNRFLKNLLEHYSRLTLQAKGDELLSFMMCLPSLKTIKLFIKKSSLNKEGKRLKLYFFKTCLDIYYKYMSSQVGESIEQKLLLKQCLLVIIDFYLKLDNNSIEYINGKVILDVAQKYVPVDCKSKEEYLEFFINEKTKLIQLTEGIKARQFIQ